MMTRRVLQSESTHDQGSRDTDKVQQPWGLFIVICPVPDRDICQRAVTAAQLRWPVGKQVQADYLAPVNKARAYGHALACHGQAGSRARCSRRYRCGAPYESERRRQSKAECHPRSPLGEYRGGFCSLPRPRRNADRGEPGRPTLSAGRPRHPSWPALPGSGSRCLMPGRIRSASGLIRRARETR